MQSPGGQPTLWVTWCLIWWFANLEKYGHTWHRMSLLRLRVIKQHKPNQTKPYTYSYILVQLLTLSKATLLSTIKILCCESLCSWGQLKLHVWCLKIMWMIQDACLILFNCKWLHCTRRNCSVSMVSLDLRCLTVWWLYESSRVYLILHTSYVFNALLIYSEEWGKYPCKTDLYIMQKKEKVLQSKAESTTRGEGVRGGYPFCYCHSRAIHTQNYNWTQIFWLSITSHCFFTFPLTL